MSGYPPPEGLGLVRRSERCVLPTPYPWTSERFAATSFLVKSIFERNAVDLVPPTPNGAQR